ncbi:hypothetical protein BJV82DRAFT_717808 [Fennellomyces sp. T-0311]|nr:hypothetical protein BJV82DRAFT_717808 [Fennellomyces sp. T-0311]
MSSTSNILQQPAAIPYRIADRDLCEWNAFIHIASHGTEEEKEAVGLPRDFKLTSGVDAEVSHLFRSAGEEEKAALTKKCKEMMEASKLPPQNLEDKKKLARKLTKCLKDFLLDFKNALDTDVLVGLHSEEPQIWNNNLEFFNSFASEHAAERLNLSDALNKECQGFYNQHIEDVRVEKTKSNKKDNQLVKNVAEAFRNAHATLVDKDVRQFNWIRFKHTNGSDGKTKLP